MFSWREAWLCQHSLKSANVNKSFCFYLIEKKIMREIKRSKTSSSISLNSYRVSVIPLVLFTFSRHLRVLDLTNNFIRFVPKEISKLTNLSILYLGRFCGQKCVLTVKGIIK